MRDKSIIIILVVAVVGTIALATGFKRTPNGDNPWLKHMDIHITSAPESERTRESSVSAEGAQQAQVTIKQGVGEMTLAGGADKLMEATFDTSHRDWLPSVRYSVEATVGQLSVVQGETYGSAGNNHNLWEMSLSSTLPVDVDIERGVGKGTLDFSQIDLRALNARLGIGETLIDLSGERSHDVSVNLECGLGQTTLVVPADVGVRIAAEKGIGEFSLPDGFISKDGGWVNAAYQPGQPIVDITVKQGVGEITVKVAE